MSQAAELNLFYARKSFLDRFMAASTRENQDDGETNECVELFLSCLRQLPDKALTYHARWPDDSPHPKAHVRGVMLGPYFQIRLAWALNVEDTPIIFGRWSGDSGFLRIDASSRAVLERLEPVRFKGMVIMTLAWNEFDHYLSKYL